MNNFEFISYIPTPTDAYMIGIAKIKLYGKIELRFKHVKTKDGNGSFFTCANYTMQDPVTQEKKYIPCFLLDSRSDEEMLQEFIRENVNKVLNAKSILKSQGVSSPQGSYYPHGMAQSSPMPPVSTPQSMDEVAANETIPF